MITLDPDFAATVQTDQYHVFITEYDGSNGLYVTARTATGFEVRAGAGAVDANFCYRVMASARTSKAHASKRSSCRLHLRPKPDLRLQECFASGCPAHQLALASPDST